MKNDIEKKLRCKSCKKITNTGYDMFGVWIPMCKECHNLTKKLRKRIKKEMIE